MPRESLDAPDDLPKEAPCQVAPGHLEDEAPGMLDEAAARLEQPLPETREGSALDGDRQDRPAQQIAEIVAITPSRRRTRWPGIGDRRGASQWVPSLPSLIHSALPRWL
jgi:hypothetical protein